MLDIGGGLKPWFGYENLDPVHGKGKFRRKIQDHLGRVAHGKINDLSFTPALTDMIGTVERARASHCFEHIPPGQERIAAFNNVHKLLSPGAEFEVIVPAFPNWRAIADPTHLGFFCAESFGYFDGTEHYDADYGILQWERVSLTTAGEDDWQISWIGRKPSAR